MSLHGQQISPEAWGQDEGKAISLESWVYWEGTAYAHAHAVYGVMKLITFWHEWAGLKYILVDRLVSGNFKKI